ncbi:MULTISPECIES: hypothetical protein [Pseudoalteromonas]|uniref:hypothetical protein n=1 Tax=Pseudoalteromonas TaxID=53246 RepID=UPI00110AE680|nr:MULTISPECIES: hypothetical protein [Pseudoalteromonas]MCG7569549.1 hypothetical protein [Pseudoalteromonas sp. CNC9-20]TMO90272.1 hypothetical protein CWC12_00375 [Pseudoalteromonas ruthenica]TMP23656.1 hypothetical protein CWC06_10480 [Pseudoalteromonas ruthenica]
MNFSNLSNSGWNNALKNNEICPYELIEVLLDNKHEFLWHPLGFVMCRVARWGNLSLRVHIWPSHKGYQQTPVLLIHDHLFHLKSWVVSGEVENKEYAIEHHGKDHAIYEASYNGDKSILEKTNTYCSKRLTKKSIYRAGSSYEVSSGVFHQSESLSNRTTLTVCETLDEIARPPRVLGCAEGLFSYTYHREQATKDEICELAKKI